MLKNWQTTAGGLGALFGAAAAVFNSIHAGQLPDPTQISVLIGTVSAGIGLLRAKDMNVTGGTVPQTAEAARRTGTSQ